MFIHSSILNIASEKCYEKCYGLKAGLMKHALQIGLKLIYLSINVLRLLKMSPWFTGVSHDATHLENPRSILEKKRPKNPNFTLEIIKYFTLKILKKTHLENPGNILEKKTS